MTTNLKKSQEREAVLKRKCEAQENDRTEMASLYNALKVLRYCTALLVEARVYG